MTIYNTCADLIFLADIAHAKYRYLYRRKNMELKLLKLSRQLPETWEREGTRRVALAARCILEPPSAETESLSYSAMESEPSWSEKAISQQQLNHQLDHHLHCQHRHHVWYGQQGQYFQRINKHIFDEILTWAAWSPSPSDQSWSQKVCKRGRVVEGKPLKGAAIVYFQNSILMPVFIRIYLVQLLQQFPFSDPFTVPHYLSQRLLPITSWLNFSWRSCHFSSSKHHPAQNRTL